MAFDRSTEPAQAIEGRPIDPNPNGTVGAGAIRASLRMNKARRPRGDKRSLRSGRKRSRSSGNTPRSLGRLQPAKGWQLSWPRAWS